jgi:prolyl oligopeptidase
MQRVIARFGALALLALLAACSGDRARLGAPVGPGLPSRAGVPPAPAPERMSPYPLTRAEPASYPLQGVTIRDDYQWLEQSDDPEVQQWVAQQNAMTRAYLDAVPGRQALHAEVERIAESSSPDRYALREAGERIFALKNEPPKQQPMLVTMKSADEPDSERVLLDPNALDPRGRTSIDFYVPSRDGAKVAVSLSQGGTEAGTLHVLDVGSGAETGDVVPYANSGTAGGGLAWNAAGTGFYFTRHPHPGERAPADQGFFQQIYFHRIGTAESQDQYALGRDFPRIAETELHASDSGKWIVASVQNGDGGEYWHYLLGPSGAWLRFAVPEDRVARATFGPDDRLYLLSLKDAPRGKILRLSPDAPDVAKAELVVAESEVRIQWYLPTKTRLYTVDLVGGPSQIRLFDLGGKALGLVPVPPISAVRQIARSAADDLLFRSQSYTEPPGWYRYRASDGTVARTALCVSTNVSFADAEVVRASCRSKDGTLVPLNILRKKGIRLDGSSPTLLSGYGGFGISNAPKFAPMQRIWLDHGGVYAVANLRGGSEFGEAWHQAGSLTHKQNVFDDFQACAEYLIAAGYTRPAKLAIIGGSNGGLLMGAALTQHPETYRAVVSFVGIYDMLRVELSPNGAFNTTEYGTVADPEQFRALYAYSPYHHVRDGVAYPATLLLTGANDPRVDPFHSRKMAARLQAATAAPWAPILLRAESGTGHIGNPLGAEIEQQTDVYAFLFSQLGIPAL